MPDVPGTTDATVDSSTTPPVDPIEAPLPEGTKEETAKRFQDLLADRKTKAEELQQFKALGLSPQDIADLRDQAGKIKDYEARIQQLEASREEGDPKTDEQKHLETVMKKARAEFFRLFPEMQTLLDHQKQQSEERTAFRENLNAIADRTTEELLKEEGLTVTRENVDRWGRRLLPYIQDDPKLRAKFFGGDPASAVKDAWEAMHAEIGQNADRKAKAKLQREKEKLTAVPRPHTGPGGGGTPATGAPKTVREGVERAMARFGAPKG